jgi:hypothetical protein
MTVKTATSHRGTMASTTTVADRRRAERVLVGAERLLRLWDTPLEAMLLAVTDQQVTDEVETAAVGLRRDGVAWLRVNPQFALDVGPEGMAFVLCHEALHLLFRHLRHDGVRDDAWTMGCEVVINHWVMAHTCWPLPISAATGEPTGIHPGQVHAGYAAVMDEPVGYDEFVRSDEDCAAYLRQLPTLPTTAGNCRHTDGAGAGSLGGDAEAERAERDAIDKVLEAAVKRAADGDERVRGQLVRLHGVAPGASALTRAGVVELIATTDRLGNTRFWEQQLAHVIGQQLKPEHEVGYDRKTGWWDAETLRGFGIEVDPDFSMPLVLRPKNQRTRKVAIYLDTSGSVDPSNIEVVATTVGRIADTEVAWHTFDHEVHPFEPGEELAGGGGTDFHAIVEDLVHETAAGEPFPDAVVVLTDGEAWPIDPPRPERWIWLVYADGDRWPQQHGMRTVIVPTPGDRP